MSKLSQYFFFDLVWELSNRTSYKASDLDKIAYYLLVSVSV
jgi:hypothetical protein